MNEELMKLLSQGEVRIVFMKKENNLIRNLLGTLNKDDIPPEQYDTLSKIITNSNSRIVVVWDMESLGWRSFYPESIVDIFQSEQKKSDRE
tara:strand:+ start:1861 stop:2133 length:273 start_codon:yes stop_codon:yes gene_type:complete